MGNEHSKNKGHTKDKALDKHLEGEVNSHAVSILYDGLENSDTSEAAVEQNSQPSSRPPAKEPGIVEANGSGCAPVVVEQEPVIENVPEAEAETAKTKTIPEPEPNHQKKEPKESSKERVNVFDNLFKKKATPQPNPDPVPEKEEPIKEKTMEESKSSPEVSVTVTDGIHAEPLDEVEDTETSVKPPKPSPEAEEVKGPGIGEESSHLEENQEGESQTEDNPVMNFFKTLVTPTKKNKQGTATPDVTKDQSQKEAQPTATTTAAQVVDAPAAAKGGMSFPPPPPPAPAPPKMEVKAEIAAQPVTNAPKKEPKDAAKESEATKSKSDSPFSRLFSRKALLGLKSKIKVKSTSGASAPAKPPAVEIDASKTATLEASAKPEPPPAPAPKEGKKPAVAKASFSFFKPKASEPKKEAPAPAADAIAGPSVAKEEPKAPQIPAVDSKPASGPTEGGDNSPILPKRLEKRNSIHLFFKNLGKRQSDAGVQTEPEKTK
ncbi:wiskott-Aldrich syndrome protein homolog 1 isoform X5 [Oncorhynchus tshawytscha]|uniref:wiskott-Aldrich syndrome protein homolog 1 isoform X5 n=1 Tax=Oncorhynchus tshawytscha TaxID=74940 RepID=UPI000D09C9F1|nr:wiskott-Aldrich syndrome protein homolog 1 isoform X5 [Oncorhynchus tshawytscha]